MSRASLDELKQEPPIHAMYGTHCVSLSLSFALFASLIHYLSHWALSYHIPFQAVYHLRIAHCNLQHTNYFQVSCRGKYISSGDFSQDILFIWNMFIANRT